MFLPESIVRLKNRKNSKPRRRPMNWSAVRSVFEGAVRADPDKSGCWMLAGRRTDYDQAGTVVADEDTSRPLEVADALEVLDDHGTWRRGRVVFQRDYGYVLKVADEPQSETLQSLSTRDARVRQVRP